MTRMGSPLTFWKWQQAPTLWAIDRAGFGELIDDPIAHQEALLPLIRLGCLADLAPRLDVDGGLGTAASRPEGDGPRLRSVRPEPEPAGARRRWRRWNCRSRPAPPGRSGCSGDSCGAGGRPLSWPRPPRAGWPSPASSRRSSSLRSWPWRGGSTDSPREMRALREPRLAHHPGDVGLLRPMMLLSDLVVTGFRTLPISERTGDHPAVDGRLGPSFGKLAARAIETPIPRDLAGFAVQVRHQKTGGRSYLFGERGRRLAALLPRRPRGEGPPGVLVPHGHPDGHPSARAARGRRCAVPDDPRWRSWRSPRSPRPATTACATCSDRPARRSSGSRALPRRAPGRGGRRSAGLVGMAISVGLIHPHELSYFNVLAGGPMGGRHILSDSCLDWGQGAKSLARLQARPARVPRPDHLCLRRHRPRPLRGRRPPDRGRCQATSTPDLPPDVLGRHAVSSPSRPRCNGGLGAAWIFPGPRRGRACRIDSTTGRSPSTGRPISNCGRAYEVRHRRSHRGIEDGVPPAPFGINTRHGRARGGLRGRRRPRRSGGRGRRGRGRATASAGMWRVTTKYSSPRRTLMAKWPSTARALSFSRMRASRSLAGPQTETRASKARALGVGPGDARRRPPAGGPVGQGDDHPPAGATGTASNPERAARSRACPPASGSVGSGRSYGPSASSPAPGRPSASPAAARNACRSGSTGRCSAVAQGRGGSMGRGGHGVRARRR